ncbi:MAG: SUF system Fe-S cluster assembly regulator [Proteobacteria bacterium]|nr:SUF system Fe-S cluster assembly regulator [Pseudomonadota bacterium]MDE3207639.1 SUF system Fe-S cluster assembly regulator [Pseudomonadota bacterium]
MLRINKLTDYGTIILALMAQNPEDLYSAAGIAKRIHLALPTVGKVLKILARGQIINATRGSQGGYTLSRAPTQISIAQIIDALEEQPFGLTECTSIAGLCLQESHCHVRANWMRINESIRLALENLTLADLVAEPASSLATTHKIPIQEIDSTRWRTSHEHG